jgi:hypothetical protein
MDDTNFKASAQYVISKPDGTQYVFQVMEVGEKYPTSSCEAGFDEYGYLHCSGFGGKYTFNRKNGRYLLAYLVGYINVLPEINGISDEKIDTPNRHFQYLS